MKLKAKYSGVAKTIIQQIAYNNTYLSNSQEVI